MAAEQRRRFVGRDVIVQYTHSQRILYESFHPSEERKQTNTAVLHSGYHSISDIALTVIDNEDESCVSDRSVSKRFVLYSIFRHTAIIYFPIID
jgi:hypothetical protein